MSLNSRQMALNSGQIVCKYENEQELIIVFLDSIFPSISSEQKNLFYNSAEAFQMTLDDIWIIEKIDNFICVTNKQCFVGNVYIFKYEGNFATFDTLDSLYRTYKTKLDEFARFAEKNPAVSEIFAGKFSLWYSICVQPMKNSTYLGINTKFYKREKYFVVTIKGPFERPIGGGASRKRLDKCTVKELREKAKSRGIKHSGLRKAELVDALRSRKTTRSTKNTY